MDYFSVKFNALEEAMQKEMTVNSMLSEECDNLMRILATVGVQPSLKGHGYVDKLWTAYNHVSTIASQVVRMNNGLEKVFDKYMEFEQKVINQADEIMTTKNGFSKSSVKAADKAVDSYADFREKNEKKDSAWDVLYDGTIGSWKDNAGQYGDLLDDFEQWKEEGLDPTIDNGYDWLEEKGVPKEIIDWAKKKTDSFSDKVDHLVDIQQGVLNPGDWDYTHDGVNAFLDEVGIDDEFTDYLVDASFDTFNPDNSSSFTESVSSILDSFTEMFGG